ncbi:hypothetical protein WJX79_009615 [Trebouxia sp. C0005]
MVSFKRIWSRLNDAHDVGAARNTAAVLMCGELLACVLILTKVPYTEIDWVAYMQQVQTFLQGERDYALIKGQTGPLTKVALVAGDIQRGSICQDECAAAGAPSGSCFASGCPLEGHSLGIPGSRASAAYAGSAISPAASALISEQGL